MSGRISADTLQVAFFAARPDIVQDVAVTRAKSSFKQYADRMAHTDECVVLEPESRLEIAEDAEAGRRAECAGYGGPSSTVNTVGEIVPNGDVPLAVPASVRLKRQLNCLRRVPHDVVFKHNILKPGGVT